MTWICIKFGTVFWFLPDLVQIFFAVRECGVKEGQIIRWPDRESVDKRGVNLCISAGEQVLQEMENRNILTQYVVKLAFFFGC